MKRLLILAVSALLFVSCSENPYLWTSENATSLGSSKQSKYYKKTHKDRHKVNRQLSSKYMK